jgi:hypothetical protein
VALMESLFRRRQLLLISATFLHEEVRVLVVAFWPSSLRPKAILSSMFPSGGGFSTAHLQAEAYKTRLQHE